MDIWAIIGLLVFLSLCWWVLQQFSKHLPDLIVTICYVVLVVLGVVLLCQLLGIPMPTRLGR